MRLTDKNKIKELETLEKNKVLMTDADYKELKLGQLENIEEELGIDLILLGKAIKGVWIKNKDLKEPFYVGSPYICFAENNKRELEMQFMFASTWYYFKDYGYSWALRREELEK